MLEGYRNIQELSRAHLKKDGLRNEYILGNEYELKNHKTYCKATFDER